MIVIDAQIEIDSLTPRAIKQISRAVNRQMMVEHKTGTLHKHFEHTPHTKPGGAYGYKKRDRDYQISKANKYKTTKPLVKSGELKQAVLQSARVTATASRARLLARGSRKTPLTSQYRSEIEAVAPDERKAIAERWARTFVTFAQRPEYRRKKRKRNAKGKFIKG